MQEPASYSNTLATRRALLLYLWVFLVLSIAGWLPEIAGSLGAPWFTADYSAFFHPTNTFAPTGAYEDLTDFRGAFAHLSASSFTGPHLAPFPYGPAAAWVFAFLLRAFRAPVIAFLAGFAFTVAAGFGLLGYAMARRVGTLGVIIAAATALLGSPQYFTANRANIEWLSCAFAIAGVLAFAHRRHATAAVLIGLAAAIKPFPLIFLALLLWKGRYRQAVLGLAVTLAVSVAALAAIGPEIGTVLRAFQAGFSEYFQQYVVVIRPYQEFRFHHALLDALKVPIWFRFDHRHLDPRPLTAATPGVRPWARLDLWAKLDAVSALGVLGWIGLRFRNQPLLNQVFALTLAELLLPYSSSEYTLVLLYLPWGLLLVALTAEQPLALSRTQMLKLLLPCAALFAPLSYMNVFSGVSKTVLLLYLFFQISRTRLEGPWDRPGRERVELPSASRMA